MTHPENESLRALEHLMEEFFNHNTTNGRKHDIEVQLNSFSVQPDAWKFCLYFVTHTSSQFVSMYALSTIEAVINRQWLNLEWENKGHIRCTLYSFLIEKENILPPFIRNKLAKLLVDIARYDWPNFYQDFFTNILNLLQSDKGQLLGLILLRITSEEFMSPQSNLTTYRKDELTRLLEHHIPQILHILTNILDNSGNKPRHTTTATPPPSPTHPSSAPFFAEQITVASFRPDFKTITKEALAATQHIFTWMPITDIPLQIIKSIFQFTHISSYAQDDDDMCVLAMSTLNELLYRKCIPPGSQNLFIEIYHNTIQLLEDLTCPASGRIETIGLDFMDKFSELLTLLMEQHLWRLECEPNFTALKFLGLLFQLTMQLPSAQCYLRCLSVWNAFIKQIKPQNANKYSDALIGLVTAVLNKMQFTYNHAQLEETNIENEGDENETEWDTFLKNSIEIIAVVAEYAHLETFNQIFVEWRNANEIYRILENSIDRQSCTLRLEHSETQRLHCILKDLSSLTQTLARLSTFFLDHDNDLSKPPVLDNLLAKLMQSASTATNIRFYHLKINEPRIVNDFVEVHSHFLAALKTWMPFLSLNEEINSRNLQELISLCLPILRLGQNEPSKVSHSAAHLLLALSTTVFPPSLVTLPPVVDFLHMASTLKYNNKQTMEVVNNALCNILIRPWGELTQQDANNRNQLITGFFDMLTKDFRELTPHHDQHKIRAIVNDVLPILSNIIVHCKNYPTTSKKLLYMGIKNSVEHALVLFPTYSKFPDVGDKILCLFLHVLDVLQMQLGVESTKHAVEIFLEVAVSEQQVKNISGVDKLLQILQIIVESPGSTYKNFLPGILQLCLQNVYPVVICQANDHPDVIISLLTLLHSILSHRWNYFYLSQVKMGHSPGCSDLNPAPDNPQQPEQLLAVLQVFGQSLLQPDINTFRTSLAAIEDLNAKWKLYHKTLFKEQLLNQFLTVLFHTLIAKTHNLLNDDIFMGIYNMASVDFQGFFVTFLPHFLQNIDGILENQKELLRQGFRRDTDMPTFVQHINRFVNDLRCFKLSYESNIITSH